MSEQHTPLAIDPGSLARNLRELAARMQYRVEAIEFRDGKGAGAIQGSGVGIGYLFAKDLAEGLSEAATFVEGQDANAAIAIGGADEIERLRKQLAGARHNAIEECAKVAEAQAQEFLSPKYAANQPYGSICERFACVEAAKAIRALLTDDTSK